MRKYSALLIAILLLLCSLTACGEQLPTPEEIYSKIDSAGSVRVDIVIDFDGVTTYTTVIEQEGDKSFVSQENETFGAVEGEIYYTATEDGKRYVYTQDDDDQWIRKALHEIEQTATFQGLKLLFDNDTYYEEDGKYHMRKTEALELDGMLYNDAVLEICEDGTYKITASVGMETENLPVSGVATITFSKIGEATVTLPEVAAAK